tara:strand:- start:8823 stop:9947 length:1125 start_codon:yes stop_codon:yes gene_type:complete
LYDSFILDGVRSPIGIKSGQMIGMRSDDLTTILVKSLIERNSKLDPNDIQDLVLGCAFPEGPQGMLMARGITVLSDLPNIPGKVTNRFCGSSMDSVHQLSQAIIANDISCGIAAGAEDMFGVPMGGFNPNFHPALYEKEFYIGMGETAEILAKKLDISRKDQEDYSISSHQKALLAMENGGFDNEIVPINWNDKIIKIDEGPRKPNIEKIKSLEPAFDVDGSVTAATSSPISIGSAAAIVSSANKAKEIGVKPEFKIKSRSIAAVDWKEMGTGPIPASTIALQKAGLTIEDIDVIEINEAFAAQVLYVVRKSGWKLDKINLNGGAIALGHPLGCSGLRILITLINVMKQNDATLGLATMCIGTGQGIATIIERV